MQDLIDRVSATAGLEPDTAAKALGIVFDFLQKNVPPETSAALIDGVPGARSAAAAAAEDEAQGGGSATPGLMGLADRLMVEGVSMSALPTLGRAMFAGLRAELGDGPVDAALQALPDLARVL